MADFHGVIIEESLEKKDVLKRMKVLKTRIEKVTAEHGTPYLKQWTLHYVEIPERDAEDIAKDLSHSLDSLHGDWYADFKNNKYHFVVFLNRVFKIDRSKPEQYRKAVEYGLSLGIPLYQLDFSQDIAEWKR